MGSGKIVKTETTVNLLNYERAEMERLFANSGEHSYRAAQIMKWIYQGRVTDFDAMTNLSKQLRDQLKGSATIDLPSIASDRQSIDGSRKWLLQLADGNCIETVFIPEDARGTLCISSQVGCSLNCRFCSTGWSGYNRNLTSAEILGQIVVANQLLNVAPGADRVISNVVLMGMGEPLLNFDNVVRAMRVMRDDYAYGLSKRRITLSTAGVVPALERLRTECDVSLAVSLHAPNDELRTQLVPLNRKYPIKELLAACRRYVADDGRRRVTFEYVMLEDVNDSDVHAHQLINLLRDFPAKINLIPFNPFPESVFRRSSQARIESFWKMLMEAGITTITRKTRGDDIDAACGQLAGRFHDRTRRSRLDPADYAVRAVG